MSLGKYAGLQLSSYWNCSCVISTSGFCETWPVAQDIQHSYCGIHEEIRLFLVSDFSCLGSSILMRLLVVVVDLVYLSAVVVDVGGGGQGVACPIG